VLLPRPRASAFPAWRGRPQDVVTLVQGIPDAQRAVRRVVEEAYSRGSMDNISAVVLKLRM
jgi:serine/threonine protein phosphatase PrpC